MPLAVLELKRTLSKMERGETIQVILEGEKMLDNIKKTILHSPDVILNQKNRDGQVYLTIQRGPLQENTGASPDIPTDTGGGPA